MTEEKHSIILGKFEARTYEDAQRVAEFLGMRVRGYGDDENYVLASRSLRDEPLPPAFLEISRIKGIISNDQFEIVLRWIGETPDELSTVQEEVDYLMNVVCDKQFWCKGESFHQDKMPQWKND